MTRPIPLARARSATWTIIGRPHKSAIGFPGRRVEAIRAGIRTRTDIGGTGGLAKARAGASGGKRSHLEEPLYVLQPTSKRPSFRPDLTGTGWSGVNAF